MATKDETQDPTMPAVLLKLAELIKDIKASSDETLKAQMASQAELLIRTMPENKQPPLISVFNPLGDRDHPRPELKCKTYQNGYQLEREQLTTEEIELVNVITPGDYRVTKADGQVVPFTVSGEVDNAGQVQKKLIAFPSKGEDRHNHLPLTSYLREAQGMRSPTVSQLAAQVAKLKAELAEAKESGTAA